MRRRDLRHGTSLATPSLLRRLLEVAQVRRRLVLLRRHQLAVAAEEVALPVNLDVTIALGAILLGPGELLVWIASILLGDRPRARQRTVVCRNVIEHYVRIGLVLI